MKGMALPAPELGNRPLCVLPSAWGGSGAGMRAVQGLGKIGGVGRLAASILPGQ